MTIRITIKFLFSFFLIFIGIKLLLPYHLYPIEHFECSLINIFPISWKFVAILSRLIVGSLFSIAFLLIFDFYKLKWAKYFTFLLLFSPFVINAVFLENLQDNSISINEKLPFALNYLEKGNNILVYVSPKCSHCKEIIRKLDVVTKNNPNFPNIVIISYNTKINDFLVSNDYEFELDIITAKEFLEQTKGSFPKFQMVKEHKILNKWTNYEFNYAVLDNLKR